ncbi:hypothetical protein [Streptomyces sp. NPDC004291]
MKAAPAGGLVLLLVVFAWDAASTGTPGWGRAVSGAGAVLLAGLLVRRAVRRRREG